MPYDDIIQYYNTAFEVILWHLTLCYNIWLYAMPFYNALCHTRPYYASMLSYDIYDLQRSPTTNCTDWRIFCLISVRGSDNSKSPKKQDRQAISNIYVMRIRSQTQEYSQSITGRVDCNLRQVLNRIQYLLHNIVAVDLMICFVNTVTALLYSSREGKWI